MAALDENLRAELVTIAVANVPVGTTVPVEQNKVSEETAAALRVFYQLRSDNNDLLLGGQQGLRETHFDIEVMGPDLAGVESLAGSIGARAAEGGLNGKAGTFGTGSVLGVFVTDQDDDYQYKGLDSDEGWHLAALDVQILS